MIELIAFRFADASFYCDTGIAELLKPFSGYKLIISHSGKQQFAVCMPLGLPQLHGVIAHPRR